MSYYDQAGPGPRSRGIGFGVLVAAALALVVVLVFAAAAPYYFTHLWWEIRGNLYWIAPILAILACGAIAAVLWNDGETGASSGMWLVVGGLVLGSIVFWISHAYLEDSYYVASVSTTNDPAPALAQRPPFNVSEQQVRPDLGETNGDTGYGTMYLPDRGEFTTLVDWRGSLRGWQTLLTQRIGVTGRNDHSLCNFAPTADRRFGGLFSHSLGRAINTHQRFVNWDTADAYGYCAGPNHPMVVTPLTEQDGWLVVTEKPAGVAVYDGSTGQVRIVTAPKELAGIPGPTYPLSLAARQRESTGAIRGFTDWFWNRGGWELPDDADQINSSNASEFALATAGDRPVPQYVTLLTGRGAATSLSATAVMDARQITQDLAPLTVHHNRPPWLSATSIEHRIHSDFGDVFAVNRTATITELAPIDGSHWMATIGLPQNMLYRVRGSGDLNELLCLYALDGAQIRCGPSTNLNGAGPGVAIGQVPGQPVPVAPVGIPGEGDWGKLTKPQLVDVIQRATAELANRQ